MTYFRAPDPINSQFFLPTGGGSVPGSGVQLGGFVDGSSTPQTFYKDNVGTAYSNPLVLDSTGSIPLGGSIYLQSGQTYEFRYAPANDVFPFTSPYRVVRNVTGVGDTTINAASEWIAGPSPTFVGTNVFTVAGDQTLIFTLGRRLQTTNTGGTIYSTITSVSFLAGVTTVNIVNDVGVLDSGLSAVSYGLFDPAHSSIDFYHVGKDGGTVSAASTTDIWGIKGSQLNIIGTSAIFSFSSAAYAGATRIVTALSSFTLNSSAALQISYGNITTQVGDRFEVMASTNASAQLTWYQKADGTPVNYNLTSSNVPPTIGGSLMLLQSTTVANVSNAQFRNIPPFDDMVLEVFNCTPSTDGATLGMQLSTNNAASFVVTSSYASASFGRAFNGSTLAAGTNVGVSFNVGGFPGSFGITQSLPLSGYSGSIRMKKFNTTSQAKTIYVNGVCNLSAVGAVLSTFQGSGVTNDGNLTSSMINAINIVFSSGNISSAAFSLYAIRNS